MMDFTKFLEDSHITTLRMRMLCYLHTITSACYDTLVLHVHHNNFAGLHLQNQTRTSIPNSQKITLLNYHVIVAHLPWLIRLWPQLATVGSRQTIHQPVVVFSKIRARHMSLCALARFHSSAAAVHHTQKR